MWGDLDKIEMTQGSQTDGEGGRIAERFCHMMQMLEICSCLVAGWKGLLIFPAFFWGGVRM